MGDERANDSTQRERNVAMVFQSYALLPNMTVRGNLSFRMKTRSENAQAVSSEVARVARLLGLTPYLDRKPKAPSGGQARRVAFGRAMTGRPKVLLFDEPLSNLDAELRVQMQSEITQLQRKFGATTVYVTPDTAASQRIRIDYDRLYLFNPHSGEHLS
ncbi:MAG: ATP-binding cassette domain-containing protein [Gammaproteobacteria bacterium]